MVRFTVEQLGFPKGATTKKIYDKIEELGLELYPAKVGSQLRLKYPGKEWMHVAMEPITDSVGGPRAFRLDEGGGRLSLCVRDAKPDSGWDPDVEFVFCPRKLDS